MVLASFSNYLKLRMKNISASGLTPKIFPKRTNPGPASRGGWAGTQAGVTTSLICGCSGSGGGGWDLGFCRGSRGMGRHGVLPAWVYLPCAREAVSTAARPDKRAGQGPRRRVFPAPEARLDTQAPRCQLLVTGTTLSDRGALIPRRDPVPEARSIRKQRDLGEPSGGTVSDLRELLTGSTPRSGRAVAQAPELRPRECARPPAALRPLTGPLSSDTGSGRGTRHPVSPSLLGRCQPRRRPLALGRTSARAHSLRRWLEGARTFPRRLWAPWRRILLLLGRLLALLAKDWARRGRRGVAGSRRWGASLSTLHPVVTEAPRA